MRAVIAAVLTVASACSRAVPELDGFTALDVAAQRTRVGTEDRPLTPQWRVVVQVQGPAALLDFVRGEDFLYGELQFETGVWVGMCFVHPLSAHDGAAVRTYELSLLLDSDEPQRSNHEGVFLAGIAAGAALEARLVVGCGDHVAARSRWVSLASRMDSVRRDLR